MSCIYECYEEEIRPMFVGLNGREVKRTPYSHPYNYDEYVKWKSNDFVEKDCSAVYSDRLLQWDREKFNRASKEAFDNQAQLIGDKKPEDIEKFLSIYFGEEIKLEAIVQGCNQWNGYPYWIFLYKEKEDR